MADQSMMDSFQAQQNGNSHDLSQLMNPPPRIFNGEQDTSPLAPNFPGNVYFGEEGGTVDENNEAKRRRIARVCTLQLSRIQVGIDSRTAGVRHVPQEENQV